MTTNITVPKKDPFENIKKNVLLGRKPSQQLKSFLTQNITKTLKTSVDLQYCAIVKELMIEHQKLIKTFYKKESMKILDKYVHNKIYDEKNSLFAFNGSQVNRCETEILLPKQFVNEINEFAFHRDYVQNQFSPLSAIRFDNDINCSKLDIYSKTYGKSYTSLSFTSNIDYPIYGYGDTKKILSAVIPCCSYYNAPNRTQEIKLKIDLTDADNKNWISSNFNIFLDKVKNVVDLFFKRQQELIPLKNAITSFINNAERNSEIYELYPEYIDDIIEFYRRNRISIPYIIDDKTTSTKILNNKKEKEKSVIDIINEYRSRNLIHVNDEISDTE